MVSLEYLQIFCDIVELRNFSRAAEKHGISQSAVSQQLAHLEALHKCQLINRRKRPIEPTPAGEALYAAARDILDRYHQAASEIAGLSKPTNRVRLAAIFSIGMHTLQPYVKRFMARYPDVHLRVEYSNVEQIYDRLLRGDIDVGVVALAKKMRATVVYPFEKELLVLVCGPRHPLAGAGAVDIHRLQGMQFVAFEHGVPTREWIDTILGQYNVTPQIVLEFDNTETIKRAVEIGSGVSILPETTVRAELAAGTLRALAFTNERFYRPTHVIVRKNRTFTEPGRYLLELLQKHDGEPTP